jgi:outer membrane lipoprotein carrier protein
VRPTLKTPAAKPPTTLLPFALLLLAPLHAQPSVPKSVEARYNRLRSLKVDFVETVSHSGRNRRQERGTLYLLRPGKMRWEYSQPAGKLFVADGKMFYLYSPNSNQVQRIKPKHADDLRAPLAFLLGRLDFSKEFGKLTLRTGPDGIDLRADARTANEVFTHVAFTIAPHSYEIRRIGVHGQDGLLTEFVFSGETVNPRLEAGLFRFVAPPGAEVLEAVQ